MSTNKKIVRYSQLLYCKVGDSALVIPVDHPDAAYVSNEDIARTSTVVSYDEVTEQFETLNTLYVPA